MYGLIGKKLGHSFSAKIFKNKFGNLHKFELIELENINKLLTYISNNPELKGFSVTIPYKKEIIPFIDVLDDVSKEINAVNTVFINITNNSKILYGYNTDVYGFTKAYKEYFSTNHKRALILGTGGAADAVNYALRELGIEAILISRTKCKNGVLLYSELTNELIFKSKIRQFK